MNVTSSQPESLRVPTPLAAFRRKLFYAISHLVLVDSFEPLKRLGDATLSIAILALTALFSVPYMLCRRLMGVPVFTRVPRIGKLGRRYTEYGFAGLDRHPILRKIPFLFNILRGDASFIGPRPAAPGDPILHVESRIRLSVKPGMVCSWWLRRRGNIDFDDEATADREYLHTASLVADFGIALRTVLALLFFEKRTETSRIVEILGIRIDNLSMAETLDWIRRKLHAGGQAVISMTNAHCVNVACSNDAYYQALLSSDLNLADGVGLRIAGKLKGTPIRQNVNGTDLFPRLCALLEGSGHSIYLLGGLPGVAEAVAAWIAERYPDTAIAGYRDGFSDSNDEPRVAEDIRRSGASVLLVAMGVPKQELWIRRNIEAAGVRVAFGVGGLFDFYSGRIPRAPEWMREIGLEWIYRLLQEPGRMWKRYLVGNWMFMARHLLFQLNSYHPHGRSLREQK